MDSEVTPEMLQQLWNDPANWKAGMFYNCKADPRVIVPKRFGIGWTINFARASAFPVLILSGAFIGLPLALLASHGYAGTWIWWITIASSFVIVSLLCWHFASRSRFKK
jgi:hypothetical protein